MPTTDVWHLSRERGRNTLVLDEIGLRWLVVERIAGKLLDWSAAGFYWLDPIAQRLMNAVDARTVAVFRQELTAEQLRAIDPGWADLWETIEAMGEDHDEKAE